MDTMDEDLKKKYLELVQYYEDDVATDSQVIDVVGLVIMVAGGAGLTGELTNRLPLLWPGGFGLITDIVYNHHQQK